MQPAIIASNTTNRLSAPLALDDLAAQAAAFARATRSPATHRAYRQGWEDFTAWCTQARLAPLPAAPTTVGLYLTARAGRFAVATLARYLAAISIAHRLAGDRLDTRHPAIADVLRGIRRTHGTASRQVAPATTGVVQAMVGSCDDSLLGRRDRALLLVGFAAALRRSEIMTSLPMSRPWAGNMSH
jgi:site-specific recombinase XerD